MSETERIFVLVLASVGFLASYAGDTTIPEKVFLPGAPLLMWLLWRHLIRYLRSRG